MQPIPDCYVQATLATDGNRSTVTFCFDQLLWDATESSQFHSNVNAGFNAGDNVNSFALNGSFTSGVLQLSCGGDKGCYTFQVGLDE